MNLKSTIYICLVLLPAISFSQTSNWAKSDRNLLYEECLAHLTTEYKSLSQEQRETISLCYLEQITAKYTKDDYQSKIDAELRRIRSATVLQCSKNIGADISKPIEEKKVEKTIEPVVKEVENKATRKNLEGHWKDEESEFWLFETGDFKMVKMDGASSKGTWKIDGDVLTLYHDKMFGTSQKDFKILMFTSDKFVYQSIKNKRLTFTVEKIK